MVLMFLEREDGMKRVFLRKLVLGVTLVLGLGAGLVAHADDEAPDAFIKRLSSDVLDTIKGDKAMRAGDMGAARRGARPRPSSKSAWRRSSRLCWYAPMRVRWHR